MENALIIDTSRPTVATEVLAGGQEGVFRIHSAITPKPDTIQTVFDTTGHVTFPDDTFSIRVRSRAVASGVGRVPFNVKGADTTYAKIPAIDPKATSVKARRATAGTSDSLIVDWTAISNSRSNYRVAFTFPSIADLDGSSATVFAYIGSTTTFAWDTRRIWWVFASDRDWVDFRTVNSASVRVTRKEMMGGDGDQDRLQARKLWSLDEGGEKPASRPSRSLPASVVGSAVTPSVGGTSD